MSAPSADPVPSVFVVEDDEDIRALIRFYLEREGFSVVAVQDGREALSVIEGTPRFALALLDLMLPYIDGLHLVQRIRSRPEWSAIPVLVLTAKSAEQDVVLALEAGANDYVVKPFRPQELIARVRRLIRSGAPPA